MKLTKYLKIYIIPTEANMLLPVGKQVIARMY